MRSQHSSLSASSSSLFRCLLLSSLLLLLLITACARSQLTNGNYTAVSPPPPPDIRPDIPRADLPPSQPILTKPSTLASELTPFLNASLLIRTASSGGILVGTDDRPFLVGEKLGERLPVLTRNELSLLATPQPSFRGQPLRADNFVRFDFADDPEGMSGELRFRRDPETHETRSELFFETGKPIFEYAFLLHEGNLLGLVNEQLALFGHTYVVREAHNQSITLYGLDTEQWLVLENGSQLEINGEKIARTKVRVDQWSILIRYYPKDEDDGGLALKAGESLRQRLQRPEALLNPLFDIVYEGLEGATDSVVELDAKRSEVGLRYTDVLGQPVAFDIAGVENGTLRWGDYGSRLHVQECASLADYCIAIGDRFLLRSADDENIVMEFRSVNELGTEARFQDVVTKEIHLVKLADTGQERQGLHVLDGAFRMLGTTFKMRILQNETPTAARSRLSVDMDGSGGAHGTRIPLIIAGGIRITFPAENETGTRLVLALEQPEALDLDEETLSLIIELEDGEPRIGVSGVGLYQEEDKEVWQGLSERGTIATLTNSEDGVLGWQAKLEYAPLSRSGLVRIVG